MSGNGALEALKQALRRLPGVGPKSAQRMAFYLMERDREGARRIAEALTDALRKIVHCKRCNNLSESELCSICTGAKRDRSLLCIVESPSDLTSLEQSGVYQGLYFVLMGRLSPLDGIGPDEIGVPRVAELLAEGEIKEVVLATNLTVEGEATAQYLSDMIRARGVRATRIAYGVPIGGELEYTDRNTLARALAGRRDV
jgi:recombination protein RecR